MSLSEKRRKELARRSDTQIDCSEIPELDERFFQSAKLAPPFQDKRDDGRHS